MLSELSGEAQRELRCALAQQLFPAPTARDRREAELGPLTRLLATHGHWPAELPANVVELFPETRRVRPASSPRERWPTIQRTTYDELRGPDALSSKALMDRYRADWPTVCRCAAALELDGTVLRTGQAWQSAGRGAPGPRSRPPYTREDCIDAVYRCAAALGRDPLSITSTRYLTWSASERARGRAQALTRDELATKDPRLPSWDVIIRCFGGWTRLMRAIRCELRRQAPRRERTDAS